MSGGKSVLAGKARDNFDFLERQHDGDWFLALPKILGKVARPIYPLEHLWVAHSVEQHLGRELLSWFDGQAAHSAEARLER